MGFTKRFVDKNTVRIHLDNSNLEKFFSPKVDSYIFLDDFSHQVYELFTQGNNETQIKSKLNIKITN